jgi:hypothetical protein
MKGAPQDNQVLLSGTIITTIMSFALDIYFEIITYFTHCFRLSYLLNKFHPLDGSKILFLCQTLSGLNGTTMAQCLLIILARFDELFMILISYIYNRTTETYKR